MQLKWTDLADIDLEKIEAHIAKENSSIVAIDVVMNIIDSTLLVLPDYPGAGRQGRLKNTRELVIDGIPFIVIYRENISTNCIEVLLVLHDTHCLSSMTPSSGRQPNKSVILPFLFILLI